MAAAVVLGLTGCGDGLAGRDEARQEARPAAPAPTSTLSQPSPTRDSRTAAYLEGYLPSSAALSAQLSACRGDATPPRPACGDLAGTVTALDERLRPLLAEPGADPSGEAGRALDALGGATAQLTKDCTPEQADGATDYCTALGDTATLSALVLGDTLNRRRSDG